MTPAPELDRGGKALEGLAAIAPELCFADHERRIADAEIEAVAIAQLLIDRPRSRRVAVEHREQQPHLADRIELEPDAWPRERIGRSAAPQVHRRDGRPVALQEHAAEIA